VNVAGGGSVGIVVGEMFGTAVGSNVEVGAIVGKGAPLVGWTITTSGEQADTKINKPRIVIFEILMIEVVFIFSPYQRRNSSVLQKALQHYFFYKYSMIAGRMTCTIKSAEKCAMMEYSNPRFQ